MSEDILGYSSHDWRKNTDDAIVIDEKNMNYAKVNDCKVSFKNPRSLKTEEVDVSRLIRVFVNNYESLKRWYVNISKREAVIKGFQFMNKNELPPKP